jgi:uncharacterized membrane protein
MELDMERTQDGYDKINRIERATAAGLGAMLLWSGLRRGGITGLACTAAGGALCWHGLRGRNPKGHRADAPSFPDQGIPTLQEPADELEEASMASFPASDPPASRRKHDEQEA